MTPEEVQAQINLAIAPLIAANDELAQTLIDTTQTMTTVINSQAKSLELWMAMCADLSKQLDEATRGQPTPDSAAIAAAYRKLIAELPPAPPQIVLTNPGETLQ